MNSFKSFNIPVWLLQKLDSLGYKNPTNIQTLVIPQALKGKSLVVRSETGSGKTHSFLIPILANIDVKLSELQCVIITPTKELASQIFTFISQLINDTNIDAKMLSNLRSLEANKDLIKKKPHIIVGTIGCLNGLFSKQSLIPTRYIKTVILDEADMLLDDGFLTEVDEILSKMIDSQIMVFSATINKRLQYVLEKYIGSDFFITSDSNDITSKNVTHYALDIKHASINECILKLINIKKPYLMLIFCSEKKEIPAIYEFLNKKGFKAATLSSDLSKQERKNVVRQINKGIYQYVVCSDLASRGLDIQNVDLVLSINLPNNLEYYYHRAGRTGRFDKVGESFFFYNNDSLKNVRMLISNKLKLNFIKFGNELDLIEIKPIDFKKKFKDNKSNPLTKEIKKIKNKHNAAKVKPGYKKKVEQEINKAKSKHRREIIKKDIRRQREKRYKEEAKLRNER